jgi:energy-coupling factor transport system permease protein
MRGIEFFRNVSIGQYVGGGSFVHRLTPATKYAWLLALMVPAIAARGPAGLLLPGAAALAIGALAGIDPLFLLRGLKPALPPLALAGALQFLFGWAGDGSAVLFQIGPVTGTLREAHLVLMATGRTLALVTVIALFTSTTSEGEIGHGIEDALAPLSALGLNSHRLALVAVMAFRFVPIVAGELEAVAKAQASRGADFGSGRGGPLAKARAYLPLFVPVVVRALERAETLAEAMEARCYTERGRTRYVIYTMVPGETIVRLAAAAFCAAALVVDVLM